MSGEPTAVRELGELITGAEAESLAARLGGGQPLAMALAQLDNQRSHRIRMLLERAALLDDRATLVQVLQGIAGARAGPTSITPVWTTPAHLAQHGQLTASIHHYIEHARESVVCSTFNFQRSSALWSALTAAAERPEVAVRVYVDAAAADENPAPWKPTTQEVAQQLRAARVFRTRQFHGSPVRNHAKFVAIDHQFLVVTSANFSKSAEQVNVELGLVVADQRLAQGVERQMIDLEAHIFERIE
ncbi:hypothetical protein AVL62_00975 [Serinicoccus chungangensis]|uniref:PLD phosphodiesterase domain-containing protein n=1 Tax=Serinicoccus chungangensis TaxID=767452 RepID=A0A0W8I6F7_9MICO|nr:DISARM system phospholipase D-like protein DrmC [Serinicoccus chungangensis]KUG53782.1 hypothetical protein AVL62_00975 [Serinicoccus chungangensis]